MKTETQLRAIAQIALLGAVPATLRSVSIQIEEKKLSFRAILESNASEDDRESLSCAAAEIAASLTPDFTLDEEIMAFDGSLKGREFSILVFRRKEGS